MTQVPRTFFLTIIKHVFRLYEREIFILEKLLTIVVVVFNLEQEKN